MKWTACQGGRVRQVALVLMLAAPMVSAQSSSRPEEIPASKPAWQWTIEERLAKRFDPADAKERAVAEERRIQELVDLGMLKAEEASVLTRSTIDGKQNPELFMPWELFNSLLIRGFPPDGQFQTDSRQSIEERAAALGFGADLWKRLGRVASPYLELRRERDRLGIAHSQGAPADQRLETSLSPETLCRARAEALIRAKREFGEEPFLRLLYEVVAPSLSIGDRGRGDEDRKRLTYVEGGCR